MTTRRILAIEPDRRQAGQLRSIARRLGTELLLAESAECALASLGERLPDLILMPALLSRRDDLALTERLRELGDAAAHIQTLTIPIFENAKPPARGGRVLAALWREKTRAAAPDGCATDTFAEEIRVYLRRAAETRQARADRQPPTSAAARDPAQQPNETSPSLDEGTPEALVEVAPAAFTAADDVFVPPPSDPLPHPVEELPTVLSAADTDETIVFTDEALGPMTDEPIVFIDPELCPATTSAESVEHTTPQLGDPETVTRRIAGRRPVRERPHVKTPVPKRRTERNDRTDVSDERIYFDPARCRFAALVATLDEIAAQSQAALGAKLDEVAAQSQASLAAKLDEIAAHARPTSAKSQTYVRCSASAE